MVTVIFFDAAGTLFRVRGRVGEIYAAVARKNGLTFDPADLEGRFRQAFESAPPLAFPNLPPGLLVSTEREWWQTLVGRVMGLEPSDPRQGGIFRELYRIFSGPEGWELYGEVPFVLAGLKKMGLKLGVISNFDSRLDLILETLGIRTAFETVVYSSAAGVVKPSPKIFLAALEEMNVRPAEAMHIGNELEADIHGALAVGMKGVLLDRDGSAPRGTGLSVIGTLEGVASLLG